MKKFIATILSAIVGLFGYTIVDTAIDSRVADLENRVEYLESVVEEYHGEVNIPTTTRPVTTVAPTTRPAEKPTAKPTTTPHMASGHCGDYVTWRLSFDGELVIAGTGKMYNATTSWANNFERQIKKVVIKDGVTSICSYAFSSCYNLTSITIPDSVTIIGDAAFESCTSLEKVTLGKGVESIGYQVFYNCTNLKAVTIGANVTEIGSMAFAGCDNLTDVYYAGTEAQWNAITIGESNARLTDATIHYNA